MRCYATFIKRLSIRTESTSISFDMDFKKSVPLWIDGENVK